MTIARTSATGGSPLDPAFLQWSTSLPVDKRLLRVDCAGSIAHVAGLLHAGLIGQEDHDALADALRVLPDQVEAGEVELPLEEDVHMAVEAWLRATVGAAADRLHTGRSRNDQVATDFKLWARAEIELIRQDLATVDRAVAAFAKRHHDFVMPAYTHRQVAIPVTAPLWIDAALSRGFARDRALLDAALAECAESPLGAGAIGGSTLPLPRARNAAALGFADPPRNPIDAIGERDHATTLVFACARIGMHIARFASDAVELCAAGLAAPGPTIACGSSMMPHKRNPDLFELLRADFAKRQGELTQILALFHGLGSGYHRDLQHDKTIVFATTDGTRDALAMTALGLADLHLNRERCVEALRAGDAIATDLTEALVAEGWAFRDAYQAIGSLVATQRSRGARLVDLDEGQLSAAGLPSTLLQALDVEASAHKRAAPFLAPDGT